MTSDSLKRLYEAFNTRDIDTALGVMHPDVDWPNGWEGGRVRGVEAVRDYWTRQWAAIDPSATPTAFSHEPDGRIAVRVRLLVKDKRGAVLADEHAEHVYSFEDDLVRTMDIRSIGERDGPPTGSANSPGRADDRGDDGPMPV